MRWTLSLWLCFAMAAPAWAQDQERPEAPEDTDVSGLQSEARALFDAGQIAYSEGRFESAEGYFRQSYELAHMPALLYNIALAADQARHDQAALDAYEQYLTEQPDSERRTRVETRIASLREHLTPPEPEPEPERAPPPPPRGVEAAPWVVFGVGTAVAITGAILVGLAVSDVSAVENAPQDSAWADVEAAYQESEALSIAGFVSLGVGGAAMIAGLAWGIASLSAPSANAVVTWRGTSIDVEGTF